MGHRPEICQKAAIFVEVLSTLESSHGWWAAEILISVLKQPEQTEAPEAFIIAIARLRAAPAFRRGSSR